MRNQLPTFKSDSGPGKLPIILTALIWPGLGQLFQKRWLIGGILAVAFGATFGESMSEAFHNLSAYYSGLTDINALEAPESSTGKILAAGSLGTVVYVVAVIDVALAYRRQRSEWNRKKHGLPPPIPSDD